MPFIKKSYTRLLARGHIESIILPIFCSAIRSIFRPTKTVPLQITATNTYKPLFLHLPYNPADTSSASIQRAFQDLVVAPFQQERITNMPTLNKYEGKVDFDQLIVCYHKQKSLRNVLAPRIGRFGTDFSVNAALKAFKYKQYLFITQSHVFKDLIAL